MTAFRLSVLIFGLMLLLWLFAAWARITHQPYAMALWPVARWLLWISLFLLLLVVILDRNRRKK